MLLMGGNVPSISLVSSAGVGTFRPIFQPADLRQLFFLLGQLGQPLLDVGGSQPRFDLVAGELPFVPAPFEAVWRVLGDVREGPAAVALPVADDGLHRGEGAEERRRRGQRAGLVPGAGDVEPLVHLPSELGQP